MTEEYDVIVAGGGPGGTTAAICCARAGLRVLLLEKMARGRHKPCGGVLPLVAPDIIEQVVEAPIPASVMSRPPQLGLTYVPPSGRDNGGRLRGYAVHNIDRDKFDIWMVDLAIEAGVEVRFSTRLVSFDQGSSLIVEAVSGEDRTSIQTKFLIGADGARSVVRKMLFPAVREPVMLVGQETWHGEGDFYNDFYILFRGRISPACSYVIPKDGRFIIGTGVIPRSQPTVSQALHLLRGWLETEFSFVGTTVERRECWGIPFGEAAFGRGNVLLVGDAAGLCNPLSGEGIRLAVESGESAASAIEKHIEDEGAVDEHAGRLSDLSSMVAHLHEFVTAADDNAREEFVRTELTRRMS
ncbi:MAG: FAD-dependent monooxygenase [Candidatus Thorarchaeota archaeon]|nr:FAD-dependent monooxygenase [Candidatus Thorarchaeota archaeon]